MNKCDYCNQPLHRNGAGWYVGADGTTDCPESPRGHRLNGKDS